MVGVLCTRSEWVAPMHRELQCKERVNRSIFNINHAHKQIERVHVHLKNSRVWLKNLSRKLKTRG